jgi:hypothetical protein
VAAYAQAAGNLTQPNAPELLISVKCLHNNQNWRLRNRDMPAGQAILPCAGLAALDGAR